MSGNQAGTQRELLAQARKQLASVTREFQRGLVTVKDPVQRRRMADAYTELMRGYVTKVRAGLGAVGDEAVIVDEVEAGTRKPRVKGKAMAAAAGLGVAAVGAVRAFGRSRDDQVAGASPKTALPLSVTDLDPAATTTFDPTPPATAKAEDL